MVPVLARESIILKCRRDHNSILGNYECGYALGLMSHLTGIPLLTDHSDMKTLHQDFMEKVKAYQPADEEEKRLLHILRLYKPEEVMDEQVEELIRWGEQEEKPWKI